MKIQEVFDHLSNGEFSQLSIGGANPGVIDESNYAKVVSYIQLGLNALYRRFRLKEGRLAFELQPNTESYVLEVEDMFKLERVLTDNNIELSINDYSDDYGVFTPSMYSLRLSPKLASQDDQTPDYLKTKNLTAVYRAAHPKIIGASGVLIAQTKTIELPQSHLEALLYFVASRVNNPIGMVNEFNAGNTWYAKYEAECRRLEDTGYAIQEAEQKVKFHSKGWV